jgi:limonene-1,2-epoxide hydrolase
MSQTHIDTLHAVMAASQAQDKAAFLAHFAADVEYIPHTSARPLRGLEWLGRFLDRYFADMTDVHWRVDRWAQNGNKLLVEGYEEYRERASGRRVGHPYMGIIEFNEDGLITAMRDYFEMNGRPEDETADATGSARE